MNKVIHSGLTIIFLRFEQAHQLYFPMIFFVVSIAGVPRRTRHLLCIRMMFVVPK